MAFDHVQFGCGLCAPQSWANFDAGPAFSLQRKLPFLRPFLVRQGFPDYPRNVQYGDVIKGLPVATGSASAVYSSHVLEHLTLAETRTTLRNIFRYLRPGGIFRFVVPDLEFYARNYITSPNSEAAVRFMQETMLGEEHTPRGLHAMPRAIFGRSRHLWMWDFKSFAHELQEAGFVDVRRASIGDSPDPRFAEVEEADRWENCLGIECHKPS